MSNEHHSPTSAHPADRELRLTDLRFTLRDLLARTALADIYRASDRRNATESSPGKNVLILLVNPVLVQQQGFANAWQRILSRPAPPSAAYPDIVAYSKDSDEYWLALNNTDGELLSERIRGLDERGLPLDSALDTLENISHALSGIQAGPFGYLEPGAIQETSTGYIILNAPLVKVQQQLDTSGRTASNKLALHSGYISPAVAVGDTPVTEDDTFSSAALLYTLLAGEAPYGERSTLTSVAQEYKPLPLKKLSKNSWEILRSALAFQRKPRAENPDKLFIALRKANKRKVLFPIAVAAALGVLAFAVYHLASKIGEMLPAPANTQQQAQVINQTNQEMLKPEPPATSITSETTQQPEPGTETNDTATDATPVAETTATPETTEVVVTPETIVQEASKTEVAEVIPESQISEPQVKEIAANEETTTTTVSTESTKSEVAESETKGAAATEKADDAAEIAAIALVDEPELEEPGQDAVDDTTKSAIATETAKTPEDKEKIRQERISALLKNAKAAISKQQIKDGGNTPGALSFLRQVNELDEDNPQAKKLINTVLDVTFDQAEQQIDANDFGEAQTSLSDGDKIIREFMVTGQLQRLVRLESKLSIVKQEGERVNELLSKAKASIRAGNLTKDDSDDDYALLHLNNLIFQQPNNRDARKLLKEIVEIRQQNARVAIEEGKLEQAGTYLGESERLIRKYRFSGLQKKQKELDDAYARETTPPAPIAEIRRSTEVEVMNPQPATSQNTLAAPIIDTFTEQSDQLPVETLPVNPISIQEVGIGVTDEVASVDEVPTEAAPNLNTAPADVPIWESGNLENKVVQPTINDNGREVYTYQSENSQPQPNQPVFNDFSVPASPVGIQTPAAMAPEQQYQPPPQQQPQQYQPQQVQVPELIPLDVISEPELELEEIPLSDIEEILPPVN